MANCVVRTRSTFEVVSFVALVVLFLEYTATLYSQLTWHDALFMLRNVLAILGSTYLMVRLLHSDRFGDRGIAFAEHAVCSDLDEEGSKSWGPLLLGLAVISTVLVMLEKQQPFFFTQDDNMVQFLPVILQAARGAVEGVFPTWNPYQLLGAPTTSLGTYALTYPITYLSYVFSRWLLRNEFLTLEVFCIFHVIGGYLAMYWAARSYRVRPVIAATSAVCCVLSGWALIASRSWYYVIPIFVFMPLLIVAIKRLNRDSGWRWMFLTGAALGTFFHAGNVQFWTYALMFFWLALFLLWASRAIGWREITKAGTATLIGIAIALPLLIVQFQQTKDAIRTMHPYRGRVTGGWLGFLLPGPWVGVNAPSDWIDPAWGTGGLILYSGTTFLLLVVVVVLCFLVFRFRNEAIGKNVWLFCGIVAFLTLIGERGFIWSFMLATPLLNKFRLPLKFLAFFNIFMLLSGAVICERLLQRMQKKAVTQWGVAAITIGLVVMSCTIYLPSWYTYAFKPFPNATMIKQHVPGAVSGEHRLMSIYLERNRSSQYWEALPHNLASAYGIANTLGYDPLIEYNPRFPGLAMALGINVAKEYGAEYVLVENDVHEPHTGGYPMAWPLERRLLGSGRVVYEMDKGGDLLFRDDFIAIYRVPHAKPLAFFTDSPYEAVPVKLLADGVEIDTSARKKDGHLVLNFLWYPEMGVRVDGAERVVLRDRLQRPVIEVPAGIRQVRMKFSPPWWKGLTAGLVLALVAFVIGNVSMQKKANTAAGAASI